MASFASSQTSLSRHSSPRYSTTSRTETRLARHLFTHWGAPRPTLILTTGSPNAETSATTVDSAHRFISTPFAPDTPCVNNQRDRQKIDHDRSFDTNAPRQLPRHLTQYSEQSRKRQVILPNHKPMPAICFHLRPIYSFTLFIMRLLFLLRCEEVVPGEGDFLQIFLRKFHIGL